MEHFLHRSIEMLSDLLDSYALLIQEAFHLQV